MTKTQRITTQDSVHKSSFIRGARRTGKRFEGNLSSVEVTTKKPANRALIYDLANPDTGLAAVTYPTFAPRDACRKVMDVINARESVHYDGVAASTLSTGLGKSAWEARYPGIAPYMPDSLESWQAYLDSVDQWDADRLSLFADSFGADPLAYITNVLSVAIGRPIERAVHPRFGRKMGAGLVRKGAPRAHFDFAAHDVGFSAAGHIGIVLILDAGPDPIQRAWNYQPEPDETGNYDTYDYMLDPRLTGFLDVATPVGCLSLLCARYLHQIFDLPEKRCTLAAHLAWLPDGDRWVIYA
jgi:hypothetical protein